MSYEPKMAKHVEEFLQANKELFSPAELEFVTSYPGNYSDIPNTLLEFLGSLYVAKSMQKTAHELTASIALTVGELRETISKSGDRINETNAKLEKANKRYVIATITLSLVLLLVTAAQVFTSLLEAMVASKGWAELWALVYYW